MLAPKTELSLEQVTVWCEHLTSRSAITTSPGTEGAIICIKGEDLGRVPEGSLELDF